ncbi:uncharacterized protein LOC110846496 isoform X1 [Folsomia candida]|uniref:uncharacterized protein LOC110846496 isoform X1 n=2 Tax=Folsomia candida TaxID=158441 RepID=UPI000B8F8A22|nr:uncharacterized protein LOC110846496 isoform X1 [Folsomia candida]
MHSLKLTQYSWSVLKDHKQCSDCLETDGHEPTFPVQIGGPNYRNVEPYWYTQPHPQFIGPNQGFSSFGSFPNLPTAVPIQEFHAQFPTYPVATYFVTPLQTAVQQFPQRTQSQYLPTSRDYKYKSNMRLIDQAVLDEGPVRCPNLETNPKIMKDARVCYLHKLSPIEVRLRYQKQRGPYFDFQLENMMDPLDVPTARVIDGENIMKMVTDGCKIKHEQNLKRVERQVPTKSVSSDSVRLEFHRKMKEAAGDSSPTSSSFSHHPPDMKTSAQFKVQVSSLQSENKATLTLQEPDFNGYTDDQDDMVDACPAPNCVDNVYDMMSPVPATSYDKVRNLVGDSKTVSDFEEMQQDQPYFDDETNIHPATEILDTDVMSLEVDSTMSEIKSKFNYSQHVAYIVGEYVDTSDWDNTAMKIKSVLLSDNSAELFVYDMITWVVQKSDVRLFRAVGSIIRQMIKTGIADKFKILEMLATKFIDDHPEIGCHWSMIVTRLAQISVEAFFNEENLNWLCQLREYVHPNTTSLDDWKMFGNQVVKLLAARTNMDFVYNLSRRTNSGLPEILPVLQQSGDSQAPIVSQASTCQALPTANHSGYSPILSKDAIEPPNLLLALKSKDVKVKIFTKPLINGTTCSQNKVSANEEEQLDKLLEHNINFLAERLRNTRDILVLLHHFGVITYNDQMRLKNISSEYIRSVEVLEIIATKDEKNFQNFLTILKFTDNFEAIHAVLGPTNAYN